VRLVKTPSAAGSVAGSAFPLVTRRSALGENTKRGGNDELTLNDEMTQ